MVALFITQMWNTFFLWCTHKPQER